jgi:hypothetical protein
MSMLAQPGIKQSKHEKGRLEKQIHTLSSQSSGIRIVKGRNGVACSWKSDILKCSTTAFSRGKRTKIGTCKRVLIVGRFLRLKEWFQQGTSKRRIEVKQPRK